MHIAEKEKLSLICRKAPRGYEKWYSDNKKDKGWLLMSMSPEIMK
jgi:hypothetical protein